MICFDTSILFTSVTECEAESVYGRQYLLTCFICLTFVSPLMFSQSYQPLKRSEAHVSDFLKQTHFSERFFVVGIVVENFWDKDLVLPCYPPLPSCPVRPVCLGAGCYLLCVMWCVLCAICDLCTLCSGAADADLEKRPRQPLFHVRALGWAHNWGLSISSSLSLSQSLHIFAILLVIVLVLIEHDTTRSKGGLRDRTPKPACIKEDSPLWRPFSIHQKIVQYDVFFQNIYLNTPQPAFCKEEGRQDMILIIKSVSVNL